MDARETPVPARGAQGGAGLVELMIGLVIGLIAVLVIYQVFTVAEGFKRNTTAAGEAQQTGLFSTFTLGLELANSGNAIATSAQDLASCADPGGPMPARFAQSFRPIPALITDGGGNSNPDSFVVNYSMATTRTSPAMFNVDAAPNASYQVQSPGGFHTDDLIVAVSAPSTVFPASAPCAASKVIAVTAPITYKEKIDDLPTDVANVTITHTGAAIAFTGVCRPSEVPNCPGAPFPGLSTLLNMGPCNRAQKIQYNLNNGVLYSTPLLETDQTSANCGQPLAVLKPNPLAANVVNMKVEYGIDTNLDGFLDTWVQAVKATPSGDWDPDTLLRAPISPAGGLPGINQIKAIRIGIIVQSEQFDETLGDYAWVLFDCNNVNKALCPGRLTGTIAAQPGNWRFRIYETVIPLRNEIWNKAS